MVLFGRPIKSLIMYGGASEIIFLYQRKLEGRHGTIILSMRLKCNKTNKEKTNKIMSSHK